jgi:hypothetical protein
MKARNILIVVALILIFFNALSYAGGNTGLPEGDRVNKTAYLIGRNFLFIIGLILLVIAYFIHRKVTRRRNKNMVDSLFK